MEEMSSIKELEDEQFDELDESQIPPADIIAFTEQRSVSDLVRMHTEGQLVIDPAFQREVVWSNSEQTRFIDSIIKQLPIPSMCLSLDYKSQTWQVIDGLQRISTLVRFLTEDDWKLSSLPDINPLISGIPVSQFKAGDEELSKFYRIVENTTIPVNVLRCDFSKKDHRDYIFEIFHRLNTGGKSLSNQEIRNCIYSGSFNDLLNELNSDQTWLRVSKLKKPTGRRYKGQELILRLFAFSDAYETYGGRLARFLNNYMDDHRNLDSNEIEEKRATFHRVMQLLDNSIGERVSGKSLTLFESFVVGCFRNIDTLETKKTGDIVELFDNLSMQDAFSQASLKDGLAAKDKLLSRMETAEQLLAE